MNIPVIHAEIQNLVVIVDQEADNSISVVGVIVITAKIPGEAMPCYF